MLILVIKLNSMNKIKTLSFFVILFILLSCNKKKPNEGEYTAIFTYDVPQGLVRSDAVTLSDVTDNSVSINGSILTKSDKHIEGLIQNLSFSQFGIFISGEWSHKVFSKKYIIKGNFTETYYQGGSEYHNTGKFEIKSN